MREAFGKYVPERALVLAGGDAFLALGLMGLGVLLFQGDPSQTLAGAAAAPLLTVALLYILFLLGRYNPGEPARARGLAAAACVLGALVAACGLTLPHLIPSEGLFLAIAVLPLFLWAWGRFMGLGRPRGFFAETAIMVGAGQLAEEVKAAAKQFPDIRLVARNGTFEEPLSIIHEHARSQDRWKRLRQLPVVGRLFPRVVLVAAAEPGSTGGRRQALILSANGIPVLSGESFYEKITGSVLLEYLDRDQAWKTGGCVPGRTSRLHDLTERAGALLLLALLFPLLAAVAIAIKLSSPGPVFFSQERVGKDGHPFPMIKFRSMQDKAEVGTGPVWAQKNDPRVTPVGRLIRKTHIDELPQLINVVLGHMSLVGPRPERPFFVEKLSQTIPGYHLRHTVRPGITGWAQINYSYGASANDAREKLKYELFYIKHRSPALDLYILFATARTLFATSGAR
ncbi:MAG: exopolysaccharide biosynthesis polyprenyl glycosylphosphotransferase [Thermodesulfobacteriota bacterium]